MSCEARYYTKEEDGSVRCGLCPHRCHILPGRRGVCEVRENQNGTLVSLVYGKAITCHNDPIEKKPLFHVLPGSKTLSLATIGCNMRCRHCQNHSISQLPRESREVPGEDCPPELVVDQARKAHSASLAFTYTEPTVYFEWAADTARVAAESGFRSVFVTNGYINAEPLADIRPYLMAANVDLKGFREGFYQKICAARLEPVKETIYRLRSLGIWVEVTTLLIPGLNDDPQELADMARFLAGVDVDMPWHLSRFHPDFQMLDRPTTPDETIAQARTIGFAAGLRFVYGGNVWGDPSENTLCPECQVLLIERRGFQVRQNRLREGACPDCGRQVPGVWS